MGNEVTKEPDKTHSRRLVEFLLWLNESEREEKERKIWELEASIYDDWVRTVRNREIRQACGNSWEVWYQAISEREDRYDVPLWKRIHQTKMEIPVRHHLYTEELKEKFDVLYQSFLVLGRVVPCDVVREIMEKRIGLFYKGILYLSLDAFQPIFRA